METGEYKNKRSFKMVKESEDEHSIEIRDELLY